MTEGTTVPTEPQATGSPHEQLLKKVLTMLDLSQNFYGDVLGPSRYRSLKVLSYNKQQRDMLAKKVNAIDSDDYNLDLESFFTLLDSVQYHEEKGDADIVWSEVNQDAIFAMMREYKRAMKKKEQKKANLVTLASRVPGTVNRGSVRTDVSEDTNI